MAAAQAPYREWQGIPVDQSILSTIEPAFRTAYKRVIEEGGDRVCFTHYAADGRRVVKTFKELDQDVRKARQCLRAHAPDKKAIATIAGNSYDHVVFIFAILVEGYSLCPINPEDDPVRIQTKCKQLGDSLAIWAEAPEAIKTSGLEVRDIKEWRDFNEAADDPERPRGKHPFIMVFTSGSTGHSKVVQQSEYSVLVGCEGLIRHHQLKPGVVLGTPLPVFHVNALQFGLLTIFLAGGHVVLFEKFSPVQLLEKSASEKVEILSLIPPVISALVRWYPRVSVDLTSLRYAVSAAAPLSVDLAREAAEVLPFKIVQGYGLSEAVNFSATMPIDLSPEEHSYWMTSFDRPSIGVSLFGCEIHVLSPTGEPVAEREQGEICLRGHTLMAGYLGHSESETFKNGYFPTGDLGYYVRDKNGRRFYFINGRVKDVIKRFGMTVSLREVDEWVARYRHEGFAAISVGFEHDISGEEVGLVVESGTAGDVGELKTFLETVPLTLRPKVVLFTNESVRTASGKPCRWKFKPLFQPFKSRIIPAEAVLIVEDGPGAK